MQQVSEYVGESRSPARRTTTANKCDEPPFCEVSDDQALPLSILFVHKLAGKLAGINHTAGVCEKRARQRRIRISSDVTERNVHMASTRLE
jgi:hypothetical protein